VGACVGGRARWCMDGWTYRYVLTVTAYRIQGGESVKEEEPGEPNVAVGTNLTDIWPVEEKMPPEQVLPSAASCRYSLRLHLSLTPTL